MIVISTNEEFQDALSELPSDHVWMLHIHDPDAKPKQREPARADFFFQPTHHGFGPFSPWHGFGRQHHFNPWLFSPWGPMDVAEKGESTSGAEGEGAVASTASGQLAPGMHMKHFGSWEPKPFEDRFGKGRVIGPVGYFVSWSSDPEKEETTEQKKEEKTEQKEEKTEPASTPAADEPAKEKDTDTPK